MPRQARLIVPGLPHHKALGSGLGAPSEAQAQGNLNRGN